jgi:DNA-binding beta-propeller fold protein YncE
MHHARGKWGREQRPNPMGTRASIGSMLRFVFVLGLCAPALSARAGIDTLPGMPPVVDPRNLYSEAEANKLSPQVANDLPLIYVPSLRAGRVYVVQSDRREILTSFPVGAEPHHIVPSWDLRTLWVTSTGRRGAQGSLTPIDPKTGIPGPPIPVADPYNLYFTPDGRSAIVVAERLRRLDFRDPHSMEMQYSIATPQCAGVNHADFSIDGKYVIFTCEFSGGLIKIDIPNRRVVGYLQLSRGGMPQDVRISPDGTLFYVADMMANGVFVIDGERFAEIGFIPTGMGAHGLYPSRDGTKLYVSNRGFDGHRRGLGSVSVIDFATRSVVANWPIPGGGSPDMGNVSADGKTLWLSGRYHGVIYAFDTATGAVTKIPVAPEPHGLAVWPQPGRYSLGHTGNMR